MMGSSLPADWIDSVLLSLGLTSVFLVILVDIIAVVLVLGLCEVSDDEVKPIIHQKLSLD